MKISQKFVVFSEYMYFNLNTYLNFLDYQSGRGDSNRNEMAKNFMEDYNPSYFGGRGFKSVGKDL